MKPTEEKMHDCKRAGKARGRGGHRAAAGALIAVMALALALPGASCGERSQEAVAFDRETADQLEKALREALEKDGIPGALVGVWVPGRGDWVTAAGVADRDTGEQMETTDLMRIGSVTKSFTATLVLGLVDEGLVGLDDPLATYLPWVPNADRVTVRMLLNHTSGIVDDYANPAFTAIAYADPLYAWDPEELARASLGTDPAAVLGETSIYSNTNYILLGMIAEQVSGTSLADAMRERIFAPLGMGDSYFPTGPEFPGEHAHSYISVGGELYDMASGIDPSITWAAGAIISTLEDMRVWAEALATGALLERETHEEQMRFIPMQGTEGAGVGYQYGLGVLKLGEFVGHNGEFSGYQTTMFYLPSQRATVVVMFNSNINPTGTQDLFTRIAALLFPQEVPEGW